MLVLANTYQSDGNLSDNHGNLTDNQSNGNLSDNQLNHTGVGYIWFFNYFTGNTDDPVATEW